MPKDFWELWGSGDFWKGKTPFAGDIVSLYQMLPETMIELKRPKTGTANVLDWGASGASLAVELATTAGIYTALKEGGLALAAKGLQKLLTRAGLKEVEEMAAKQGTQRLFTYQVGRPFVDGVVKTGKSQGRLWATRHGPESGWYFKPGMKNIALRLWRTGRAGPYNTFKEITGPAAKQYTKVQGVGPLRLWKRFGGQYYTSKPGDLHLKTGRFLEPSRNQTLLRYWDSVASYGLDITAVGGGAWLARVALDDFDDVNLPPVELPSPKKAASLESTD